MNSARDDEGRGFYLRKAVLGHDFARDFGDLARGVDADHALRAGLRREDRENACAARQQVSAHMQRAQTSAMHGWPRTIGDCRLPVPQPMSSTVAPSNSALFANIASR